jgi:hypothetical protein
MKPLNVAAQFAAFTWYTNARKAPGAIVAVEARQFARENWEAFLGVANEGLGKLLLRVARTRSPRRRRGRAADQTTKVELAAV